MTKTAALCAADRNPYSWSMDFWPYADGSGYETRFTKCGICALTGELGLAEFIPAMCRLDYDMAEAGGTFDFVRENTLAAGGPCCDCGYKRKSNGSIRKEYPSMKWHRFFAWAAVVCFLLTLITGYRRK